MNGAVHGDAIATASTPDKNELTTGCLLSSVASLFGRKAPNSNIPARLVPITVNSAASVATTSGDCSWKPHPSCWPAARRPTRMAPSNTNDTTTPAENARPLTRWPRLSSAWRAKPITLIARTGNTQGIRLRIRPPSSAPSSAVAKVRDTAEAGWLKLLRRNASSSAGDTPATAATCGHWPTTWASARQPLSPRVSTNGISVGLWLRWSDKGTTAFQTLPSQDCATGAAVSITSFVSGKNPSTLPRASAGNPGTLTLSVLPSIRTVPALASGRGCAWKLALKTSVWRAVLLRAGILSANSPSSGTHSLRHISHCAFSLISKSPPRSEGLNRGVTVSGTGRSTVPL
ncbi:hypothetical protein D9M73_139210 [compost metagenome]